MMEGTVTLLFVVKNINYLSGTLENLPEKLFTEPLTLFDSLSERQQQQKKKRKTTDVFFSHRKAREK